MKKQPSRQRISHAVGWVQFVLELVHGVEGILFDAVAGDVGDGDEQVRQHVADVAGQDHRHALALVEGLPGLALLAVLVDGPGLDGDLGPVVAGDDAVDFVALLGHGLALGEVLQEGVLFPVAALLQERVDRSPGDGAAQVGDAAEVVAGLEGVPEGREGDVLGGVGLGRVGGVVGVVGGVRGGRVRGRVGVCCVGLVRVPAAGRQGEGQQGGQAQGGQAFFKHRELSFLECFLSVLSLSDDFTGLFRRLTLPDRFAEPLHWITS